jgi:hypothetical protein
MKNKFALMLFLAASLGTASACTTRIITAAQDQAGTGATILEGPYIKNYLIFASKTYMYWECKDVGEKLICNLGCDAPNDMDLRCQVILDN